MIPRKLARGQRVPLLRVIADQILYADPDTIRQDDR